MKRQFFGVLTLATATGAVIAAIATYLLSLPGSTHLVTGVFFSWLNIVFYAFIALMVLSKKNIAWVVPLIVIKYVILVSVVYYIWASTDVALVLVGIFLELILTAILAIPFRRQLLS